MDRNETPIASPRASFGRAAAIKPLSHRSFQPPAEASAPTIDTKRVAAQSFAVMGRNTVPFLALIAAAAAPERILYHTSDLGSLGSVALMELVTVLSCGPLYVAVLSGALTDLNGEPVRFANCLRAALRAPIAATILGLCSALAAWLLLLVPGIGPASRWAVAAPAAFAESTGFEAAFARSTALTAPCRPQIRTLLWMLIGLAITRALAIMPVWGAPFEALPIFLLGNWLFPLLLTAFTAAASAVLYQALTGQAAAGQ
jgi:hypothetical protein